MEKSRESFVVKVKQNSYDFILLAKRLKGGGVLREIKMFYNEPKNWERWELLKVKESILRSN